MSGAVPRILALVAAVAMVIGALAIRNRMDETEVERNQTLRLVCATELEDVCRQVARTDDADIELVVEDAGTTFDELRGGSGADVDGWVTPGPFPQMVQELRRFAGLRETIADVSPPLARTRIGVAAYLQRARRLACQGPLSWRCIGDAAARPWADVGGDAQWGTVTTAFGNPRTSASGLLALGAATAGFFGRADVSSADLNDDDAFAVWFEQLRRAEQPTDIGRLLTIGPAAVGFLAGLEAELTPAIAASAKVGEAAVIYPSPVASADVVFGTMGTSRGRRLAEILGDGRLRDELLERTWTRPGSGPTNLPSPGLLSALRDRWSA